MLTGIVLAVRIGAPNMKGPRLKPQHDLKERVKSGQSSLIISCFAVHSQLCVQRHKQLDGFATMDTLIRCWKTQKDGAELGTQDMLPRVESPLLFQINHQPCWMGQ